MLRAGILEIAGTIHPDAHDFIDTYSHAADVVAGMEDAVTTGEIRF